MTKKLFLPLFFTLTLLLCVSVLINQGEGKWAFFQSKQLEFILYALLINMLCVVLDFYNWLYFIRTSSHQLKQRINANLFLSYLSGFAIDFLPVKSGTFSRAFFLFKTEKFPITHGVAVQASALIIDLGAATLITILFVLFNLSQYTDLSYIMAYFIAFIFSLSLLSVYLIKHKKLKALVQAIALKWLSTVVKGKLKQTVTEMKELLQLKQLYHPMLIKLISWMLLGVSFYTLISGFGYQVELSLAITAVCVSAIAGGVSLLPGGIGTTDLSLYGFCVLMGIPLDTSLVIVFLYRLISFWYLLIVGNLCSQWVLVRAKE